MACMSCLCQRRLKRTDGLSQLEFTNIFFTLHSNMVCKDFMLAKIAAKKLLIIN